MKLSVKLKRVVRVEAMLVIHLGLKSVLDPCLGRSRLGMPALSDHKAREGVWVKFTDLSHG